MLWLTSTLSTLSRLISNVCRLMNPVLWTTRRLVTSVSVVQRWNQAVAVLYSAKIAAMAAIDQHNSVSVSVATITGSTSNTTATSQAAIAGRKNIQCALVEYSTFSPGCRLSPLAGATKQASTAAKPLETTGYQDIPGCASSSLACPSPLRYAYAPFGRRAPGFAR